MRRLDVLGGNWLFHKDSSSVGIGGKVIDGVVGLGVIEEGGHIDESDDVGSGINDNECRAAGVALVDIDNCTDSCVGVIEQDAGV